MRNANSDNSIVTIIKINMNKIKIQFLTVIGCHECEAAKKMFNEIMPDFPNVEVEEINIMETRGQELVLKYGILASPGIVINGELFSSGDVNKEKLIAKLRSLT